jgi:hypothetical protein
VGTSLLCIKSGYGLFTKKDIDKGQFVVEYAGFLLDPDEADELANQDYVFYFNIGSKKYR